MRIAILALILALLPAGLASAGTVYEVTSNSEKETVTYRVKFGGGKLFEQYTAYNPASGAFVYLSFKRGEKAPEPAGVIWDHETGREIKLYKFPGVDHPLPVIPSIKAMKVCPKTGDKDFKSKAIIAYD